MHLLVDVHSAGFAPAFTVSLCDSEAPANRRLPIASVVMGNCKKKNMKTLIYKILIFLKIRKPFRWPLSEFEIKKLEQADLKIFKPTLECLNTFASGGKFEITLSYIDLNQTNKNDRFKTLLQIDKRTGISFSIILPNILNIGSVKYKESYGLDKKLLLQNSNLKIYIPENSVSDFETVFPAKPHILKGRFTNLQSLENRPQNAFCRKIIPINDKEAIYPTSILEFKENHMKFDISNWDRQQSLIGIPFMSTLGMYADLTINNLTFHFLLLHITTEAMGILRFAGASLSQSETVKAGAKPAKCTSASL